MQTGPQSTQMPVGVVMRRTPGVTRWAKWHWRAVAVLPGAGPADWAELRRDGDAVEYHAATLPVHLYSSDTEAYAVNLADGTPSVYIVLRREPQGPASLRVFTVTVSPYEAQDYADSGEEIVEKVAMSDGMIAWIGEFVAENHVEEAFVKRRRKGLQEPDEDGLGDPRIPQQSDVHRAPRRSAG